MRRAGRRRPLEEDGLWYWWPVLALAVVMLLYAGFAGLIWWLQADARQFSAQAMQEFPGDEVEALLALARSERHALARRNAAVHALGQIGDRRALPVLEKFYTGGQCQHDRLLCQYELSKAIDRCNGKNWAPRWLPFFPRPPESRRSPAGDCERRPGRDRRLTLTMEATDAGPTPSPQTWKLARVE